MNKRVWPGAWRRAALRGLCVAAALLVAGCSHFGNAELQITPAVFSECAGPDIVVHVAWNATRKTRAPVNLFVHKPGQTPVLWRQGEPKGEADTGAWASDGWTVDLVDQHGRLLATRTLVTTACPSATGGG